MKVNAMSETYVLIFVLNKLVLFTASRIDKDTIPDGVYLYEIRGDDETCSKPVQIAENIKVNHLGSIITKTPIDLPADGKLDIDADKDVNFMPGEKCTWRAAYTVHEYIENVI